MFNTLPNKKSKMSDDQNISETISLDAKALNLFSRQNAALGKALQLLYNDKYAKRTDQKWSGKVFKVVNVVGRTITLDDNSIMKRENLLKVSSKSEDYEDPVAENKRINKEING